MGQTNFEFLFDFDSDAPAKAMQQRLEKLDKEYRGELAPILQDLLGKDCVGDQSIDTDGIQRKKSTVLLLAYGGRSVEPPFDAVAHMHELGCTRGYLRAFYDEGEDGAYYIGKRKVNVDAFTADRRGEQDKALISKLYLPKGRVAVNARLVSEEWDSNDNGEFWVLQFETDAGEKFYYKGNSKKLILTTKDEYAPEVSFSATFEVGYFDPDSPPVSFAKRPTKIKVLKLDAKKSGTSVLRGDEKKFAAEAIGTVVHQYFEDYNFDCNRYFKTLTKNSFLGVSFTELLRHAAKSKVEYFMAFGLDVEATPPDINRTTSLKLAISEPQVNVDFKGLVSHIEALDLELISSRKDSDFFCVDWATKDACCEVKVWPGSFELELRKRIKVCGNGRSVATEHRRFNDNPGMASSIDWRVLFELAQKDAEAGVVKSMNIYAGLLESGRSWERRPDEARQWRDKAGDAGDAGALLQIASILDRRDDDPEALEEALIYFQRAAALGSDQAWDSIERLLKWRTHILKSITPEELADGELDRSNWLTDDKDWMRARRASWKELEPNLKPRYKVKELARRKKYFLSGEIATIDSRYKDQPTLLYLSLLELLWMHPSEDPKLLLQIREQYFKQADFRRRMFHDMQYQNSRYFVQTPSLYREGRGGNEPLPMENSPLYFRVINGDYGDYGYTLHGMFLPFRNPGRGIKELKAMGHFFHHEKLTEQNQQLVYLDPDALEWWYKMLPGDVNFATESDQGKLPYVFLALYWIHRFPERGIDCPVREDLGIRLRAMLDERPFCDDIKRLWVYVRDTDFTLKNAWGDQYDPRKDWKKHMAK